MKKKVKTNEKKYLLIGGEVKSLDGDIHYISPKSLLHLYRLKPEECVLLDDDDIIPKGYWTILGPRRKGDYLEYLDLVEGRV